MKTRHSKILEYITEHGKTEVSVLSDKLQASTVTIRKDLDYLEEPGRAGPRQAHFATIRETFSTVWPSTPIKNSVSPELPLLTSRMAKLS